MRILRLDLRRYGPFTDAHLHFRPQARLHLVYGANEAGKSSALVAIGDLLFGFPHTRQQDFLHEAGALRIGAEIMARNGTVLRFRRRRGNKNTILADDQDEAALPEDALLPFVGTLGREVFARAFGLDSHALRAGGQAMLDSEGELGSALFAAASGLTDLARVRRALEAEADQIFAPRASKDRRFYQALERYQTALKTERDSELKSGDWRRLNAEIGAVEAEIEALRTRRLETTLALDRLRRLRQLAPIVGAIDRDTAALQDFIDLPELSPGFASEARAAMAAAMAAEAALQAAEQIRTAAAAALAEITVDASLLARADTVVELFSRRGDYLSKVQDRPRIERERDEFTDQLAAQARRLGLSSLADMVAAIPSGLVIEDGKALLDAGRRLDESIAAEEERLGAELATAQAQEAERAASGLSDPKPLRDQLAALAPDLKQLEARDYLEGRLRDLRSKLDDGARRLAPPVASFEKLAHAPLPGRTVVEACRATLRLLLDQQRAETDRFEANAAERAALATQLRALTPTGPDSYEDELRVARDERDHSLAALRLQLLSAGNPPTPAEAESWLDQLDHLSAAADALADQAIVNAHRTSRFADLRQRIAALEFSQQETEASLAALKGERAAAEQALAQLFAPAGIAPGSPESMLEWLAAVDNLLAIHRDVQALEGQIASLDRVGDEVRAALLPLADAAGATGAAALAPLALSRLVGNAVEELAERWTARLSLDGMRRATRIRIGQIEETLGKLRRERDAGQKDFQAMLEAIRLPPDSSVVAASVALSAWAAVPDLNREWSNRAARVDGMVRDVVAFEAEVRALTDELAPALADLPPQAMIDRLREGAEAARAARARREDARQRLAAAEEAVLAAATIAKEAQGRLDALLAALPPDAAPAGVLDRLDRRETLRRQVDGLWADFRAAADGMDEDSVRPALADYDPARAPLDAEDLERQSDALHVENNRLYALLGQKQAERERLEAGSGSELAAFERRGAEVEIVANARQWAVRRIAAAMLAGAIERYRDAQSDPLMARAGELFAAITQGSFSGLAQDYDEDDRPSLVGVRPNGARLNVAGMSEGARDQLYLALRLAYIEDYAGRAEPVPFIGDDIFQTFDDDRTAAGISALAAGTKAFQPILFTHHLSVVAIARRVLGAELDYIEL
jgi:uncharacterized protein YhaN